MELDKKPAKEEMKDPIEDPMKEGGMLFREQPSTRQAPDKHWGFAG